MLTKLKSGLRRTVSSTRVRRTGPRPPVVPARQPATFRLEVRGADDRAAVESSLRRYGAAFEASDDVRLLLVGADDEGDALIREVLDRARPSSEADRAHVTAVTDREEPAEGLRAEALSLGDGSVTRLRRLYVRHEELDQLVARAETLYDDLLHAAEGHPQAAEVGPLLETFIEGYGAYVRSGTTPAQANAAMRELFVITNGEFNRVMEGIHGQIRPPYRIERRDGILTAAAGELPAALEDIRRDGLHVFSGRVPELLLEELEAFARSTPLLPQPAKPGTPEVLYDESQPVAPAYFLQPDRALTSPALRKLYADTSVLSLAQDVLGCQPVISHLGMWWTTAAGGKAVSEIAQLYHFDMDKLAFIQFFIYLTDVGPENGPHTFVRGSHRHRPMPLRRDGRIPDEEIRRQYPAEDILEICGPRGTIFAVDTTAFHKGKPVTAGHRLVVQWVYASSLFGSPDAELPLSAPVESEFLDRMHAYPSVFEKVVPTDYAGDSGRVGRWAAIQ